MLSRRFRDILQLSVLATAVAHFLLFLHDPRLELLFGRGILLWCDTYRKEI